jgi:hypothetical protein
MGATPTTTIIYGDISLTVGPAGITVSTPSTGSGVVLPGTGTVTSPSSVIPVVPQTVLQKILAIVEGVLPSISTVIPIAGPIGGLIALGIQLVEGLFPKGSGAAKKAAVVAMVSDTVNAVHSTSHVQAPPGSTDAIAEAVQQSVNVYKQETKLLG